MTGVEPASKAWEAFILPMNYIRKRTIRNLARKARSCKYTSYLDERKFRRI